MTYRRFNSIKNDDNNQDFFSCGICNKSIKKSSKYHHKNTALHKYWVNKNLYKKEGIEKNLSNNSKNVNSQKEKSNVSEKKKDSKLEYTWVSEFLIPKNFIHESLSEYFNEPENKNDDNMKLKNDFSISDSSIDNLDSSSDYFSNNLCSDKYYYVNIILIISYSVSFY